MKKIVPAGLLIVVAIVVAALALKYFFNERERGALPSSGETATSPSAPPVSARSPIEVIAENLEIPWDIAFLPDGSFLVTEREGRVTRINNDGSRREVHVPRVEASGEGGLLGIALHPAFSANRFVYLYMTAPGTGGQTENRVVRYRYDNDALVEDRVIISGIPGALYHDGGRIEFGPDNLLYITTGDATTASIAQDVNSLGGKILRVKDDGTVPAENPLGTSLYSYGHRNPQGLAWDDGGRLWETEHGRSGALSGLDEINLISAGKNYGWPDVEGDETMESRVPPAKHSGASVTWAPASAAFLNGRLYFGGLRGEALYEAILDGSSVASVNVHIKGQFGRIRTVRVGPDGMLYLTTSNRDGRGTPAESDDRIIRIDPRSL